MFQVAIDNADGEQVLLVAHAAAIDFGRVSALQFVAHTNAR
jgi:hypothetical protein